MNHSVPDWSLEDSARPFTDLLPVSNHNKFMGPDQELAELLWRNGQVFLSSQNHKRPVLIPNESKHIDKPEELLKGGGSLGNSSNLIQEDETASWLQYTLDEQIEKEFCSALYEIPTVVGITDASKSNKEVVGKGEKCVSFGASEEPDFLVISGSIKERPVFEHCSNLNYAENTMPPPKSLVPQLIPQGFNSGAGRMPNFSHFSRPRKGTLLSANNLLGKGVSGNVIQGDVGGSSMMSNCGSNQVGDEPNLNPVSSNGFGAAEDDRKMPFLHERRQMGALEQTITSSSGGSRGSLGRTSKETTSNQSLKRKSRDVDESECQSEDTEYESVGASKPAQRSASARRSRAAEVHNLSERRRRDRINEKMKALQELIPHSSKSDKASMLDEAIEYLKSLQLQVQMMWMGSGMTPMMFPGVQHYMSPMSMGVGHGPIHSPMQFPRVPLIDQTITSSLAPNRPPMCPAPVISPVNFQNQIQNASTPESYARYLGFHPIQTVPQAMNLFTYGSQRMQHGQRIAPPDSSGGPNEVL
ncbi:hypothetical protein AAC387_Pa07g3304 [Persea americana]